MGDLVVFAEGFFVGGYVGAFTAFLSANALTTLFAEFISERYLFLPKIVST